MQTIKIQITDPTPGKINPEGRFLLERLKRLYNVEISDTPDYVFFPDRDSNFLKYPNAIRIMYTGENVHPNLNLCDYAVTFDLNTYDGRNFRLPLYHIPWQYHDFMEVHGEDPDFENISLMSKEELGSKTGFCSFVYGNGQADPRRLEFLEALSIYKRVDASGTLRNNTGTVVRVTEKVAFENNYKFTIAFENSSREGYVTEKLPGALAARTIPIYFGDPEVGREFNTNRFINVHDYSDFAAVIDRVRDLDTNDDEYLRVVNEPILPEGHHHTDVLKGLDAFLQSIIDQPHTDAQRLKINSTHQYELEQKERFYSLYVRTKDVLRPFITPLKNIYRRLIR